ncbi:MAG: oligosaccharide flippase family protein [Flavobacteriales bacterium]
MNNSKKTYRQVIIATSLFGGVQIIKIIISILRSKAIALFIGPTGMGIASLLTSTLSLINGFTNFGLNTSAVKEISLDKQNKSSYEVSKTISILKRLVWFTITIGVVIMVFSSSLLSEFAFGNKDYTITFIWISIALLFQQLANSHLAILQGLRKLKYLAKANLLGNIFGLLITLPLYFFYQLDGILPAILGSTFISFIFTYYYVKKLNIEKVKISNKVALLEGKSMISLGFTLSISSMIGLLVAYILQIFISKKGGVMQVGLYNAGFLILNSYVGIIFNAMGTDYFPRLAAISNDIKKIKQIVFEQALIAILLITPIIVAFLALAPFIITILYSNEFSTISTMVSWGILGMIFKAVSWSMGYIIIAKGDSKVFIKTAIGFNFILLILNLIGYSYLGLEGLGISFFVYYIIHYISIRAITFFRYDFYFKKEFHKIFTFTIFFCFLAFSLTFIENKVIKYLLLGITILISSIFSYKKIDEKLDVKNFIKSLLKK